MMYQMRKRTNKISCLISLVFQLIGENDIIFDAIKSIYTRGGNKPTIDIIPQNNSSADIDTNNIKLSLLEVIEAYERVITLDSIPKCNFVLDEGYGDYCSDKCIRQFVEVPSESCFVEKDKALLEGTAFINDVIFTSKDVCTIYSMAYSLYHEIGHLIHDKYIPKTEQIRREQIADMFAFRAIKSSNDKKYDKSLLLGSFIGVTHILKKTTPQKEKEDIDHPYTVDRITSLLNYWEVPDESIYWELAYKEIKKWRIETSIDWENETYNSGKEKYTNASKHFKKWAKQ